VALAKEESENFKLEWPRLFTEKDEHFLFPIGEGRGEIDVGAFLWGKGGRRAIRRDIRRSEREGQFRAQTGIMFL